MTGFPSKLDSFIRYRTDCAQFSHPDL